MPAQVLIVLASNAPGARDPRLADVPALRRPPSTATRRWRCSRRRTSSFAWASPARFRCRTGAA
ncbi:MAG: hypothetical protein M5U28_07900 [Sandaracinaceae bacterium]|nr:hypothetical protein [Sandaracinaceae bacterium]